MALHQTALVRDRLIAAHPDLAASGAVEIVTIRTTGDRVQDRRLAEIGGKGLFTKEIDQALIDGHVDLAVHSLKDVETWLPEGLEIACVLPRDDPRDAFLSEKAPSLAALSQFTVPGTTLMLTAESYLSFVLLSMLVSFLVLELPVVLIALTYIGILDPFALARQRRLVFIALLIIFAVLTPTTDPVLLMVVVVPAMLLMECGLVIAKRMYTKHHG